MINKRTKKNTQLSVNIMYMLLSYNLYYVKLCIKFLYKKVPIQVTDGHNLSQRIKTKLLFFQRLKLSF